MLIVSKNINLIVFEFVQWQPAYKQEGIVECGAAVGANMHLLYFHSIIIVGAQDQKVHKVCCFSGEMFEAFPFYVQVAISAIVQLYRMKTNWVGRHAQILQSSAVGPCLFVVEITQSCYNESIKSFSSLVLLRLHMYCLSISA